MEKYRMGGVLKLLVLALVISLSVPMNALGGINHGQYDKGSLFINNGRFILDTSVENTWGSNTIGISCVADSEGRAVYNGNYITFNDVPVLMTDSIYYVDDGTYTTASPPRYGTSAAPLDITVSESINLHGVQGQSDLSISPLTIKNNSSSIGISVTSANLAPSGNWSLASASSDFTTNASKGTFSLSIEEHDFSTGAYTPDAQIAAGTESSLSLSGKISTCENLQSATSMGTISLTVEKFVNNISFSINGTPYQAENGMTWREWLTSQYNVDGYRLYSDGTIKAEGYDTAITSQFFVSIDSITLCSGDDAIIVGQNYKYGTSQ